LDKLIEKIKTIAEERFTEEDLSDCFIVDIVPSGSKLEVFIDSDDGVKFWQCQKLSRAIEAYLDETAVLGTSYVLEVSSPGVDKPLKFRRQYPRNVGRKIEVLLKDGHMIEGRLLEVNSEDILVESKGEKKKELIQNRIKFVEINNSKILITFSK
jgi:ribosome maturation factor RimP